MTDIVVVHIEPLSAEKAVGGSSWVAGFAVRTEGTGYTDSIVEVVALGTNGAG